MNLNQIKLNNYRNYETSSFEFNGSVNVIVGQNGKGKTNLIDAVYYLCIGKSYFNARDVKVVKYEQDYFRIEGRFNKRAGEETKMVVKWGNGKKKALEIDDVKLKKYADHIGQFPVIIIAPKDVLLLIKGSEERRKFMDSTISQYDVRYLNDLIQYTRLIKQRNAVFKHFQDTNSFDQQYIDTLDSQIQPLIDYIHSQRIDFVNELSQAFEKHYQQISGGQEKCSCTYESQLLTNSYLTLTKQNLLKDKILCRSRSGIHKDDLVLEIEQHRIQDHGSQGQIKSVVLALKLAQFSILKRIKETTPILLLDDLFDKLDNTRVKHLLELLLSEDYGQVFITDTSVDRVPIILAEQRAGYSVFEIE